MKIHRSTGYIHIDLSGAEATVLLEELENVRGGAKLPKLRQVCEGLKGSLSLASTMPSNGSDTRAATHLGRLGGLKGGHARAAALSPKERSIAAQKAAEARWHGPKSSSDKEPPCES
jgi:hypothetical protein